MASMGGRVRVCRSDTHIGNKQETSKKRRRAHYLKEAFCMLLSTSYMSVRDSSSCLVWDMLVLPTPLIAYFLVSSLTRSDE